MLLNIMSVRIFLKIVFSHTFQALIVTALPQHLLKYAFNDLNDDKSILESLWKYVLKQGCKLRHIDDEENLVQWLQVVLPVAYVGTKEGLLIAQMVH